MDSMRMLCDTISEAMKKKTPVCFCSGKIKEEQKKDSVCDAR